MGAYASSFRNDATGLVGEITHPSKEDWITVHATATGLTLVEVERLWQRFQQLGCNENGTLDGEVLNKPPASEDIFVRNILANLIEDQLITFQGFLSAMKWTENSNLEKKIRALFHLLNNGEPLTRELLGKVLSRVYPEDSKETVKRITDVFFQQMDSQNQGYISEDQFVGWVKTLPAETVSEILSFHILPPHVNAAAQAELPTDDPRPPSVDTVARQIPSDAVLQDVAARIARRNWHLVANKLEFTFEDIERFETNNPGKNESQVLEMLKTWRSRDEALAYTDTLEAALRECEMSDVALRLYP